MAMTTPLLLAGEDGPYQQDVDLAGSNEQNFLSIEEAREVAIFIPTAGERGAAQALAGLQNGPYVYPKGLGALLELGHLTLLEQGFF